MTPSAEDTVRAVWDLYNEMTTDLAVEHANAEFKGVDIDWTTFDADVPD